MARSDFVNHTKDILYNSGLGEKPSIRRVASDASVSTSGALVTFSLASGEGTKVRAGQILSSVSPNEKTKAFVFYVVSVATDAITAVNGYNGAPSIASSATDINSGILEHQALVSEFTIHQKVDTIFSKFLYPDAYKRSTRTITPDLTKYESELPAAVERVTRAVQRISGFTRDIEFGIAKDLHTTVSSTGSRIFYRPLDGSTIFLTTIERLAVGDEATDAGLIDLVASGAAALSLDASVAGAMQERAKKDATQRQLTANDLWRSYITVRNSYRRDLGEDNDQIIIERG
jgi:hypothetical protein